MLPAGRASPGRPGRAPGAARGVRLAETTAIADTVAGANLGPHPPHVSRLAQGRNHADRRDRPLDIRVPILVPSRPDARSSGSNAETSSPRLPASGFRRREDLGGRQQGRHEEAKPRRARGELQHPVDDVLRRAIQPVLTFRRPDHGPQSRPSRCEIGRKTLRPEGRTEPVHRGTGQVFQLSCLADRRTRWTSPRGMVVSRRWS